MSGSSPRRPTVGVGVVVLDRAEGGSVSVVLIRRGQPPRQGQLSIPGGKQEFGETVREAAVREVKEEVGLDVEILGLVDVVDLVAPDAHFTLIDFVARPIGGVLAAGSDAASAEWVKVADVPSLKLWDETQRIINASVQFLP